MVTAGCRRQGRGQSVVEEDQVVPEQTRLQEEAINIRSAPPPSQSYSQGVRHGCSSSRGHQDLVSSSSSKGHQIPPLAQGPPSRGRQSPMQAPQPQRPTNFSRGRVITKAITFAGERGRRN